MNNLPNLPSDQSTLKLVILLDQYQIQAWQKDVVERLANYPHIQISLIVTSRKQSRSSLVESLLRNYRKLESLKVKKYPLHDRTEELDTLLQKFSNLKISSKQIDMNLDDQTFGVDLIIDLTRAIASTDFTSFANQSVWSIYVGIKNMGGLFEVIGNRPYVVTEIVATNEGGIQNTIYSQKTPVDTFSWTKTSGMAFWRLGQVIEQLVSQKCSSLPSDLGGTNLPSSDLTSSRAYLDTWRVSLLIWDFAKKFIKEKFSNLLFREQWILLIKRGIDIPTRTEDFQLKLPPKDRFMGDPFLIKRNGHYYCFFEESLMKPKKGYISYMALGINGDWGPSIKVIEKPYHLSYPFLFEWENGLYMIPESSADKTIQLYKCNEFPHSWIHVHNLMDDIIAVDSTLINYGGLWWLFANIKTNPGGSTWDELHLFHADSPVSNHWTPHKNNPIKTDVTNSRPAGRIFERKGKIYRPAQDSSYRYGYGMVVNQIVELSKERYREKPHWSMHPDGDDFRGMHTLNFSDQHTIIDAIYRRRIY